MRNLNLTKYNYPNILNEREVVTEIEKEIIYCLSFYSTVQQISFYFLYIYKKNNKIFETINKWQSKQFIH